MADDRDPVAFQAPTIGPVAGGAGQSRLRFRPGYRRAGPGLRLRFPRPATAIALVAAPLLFLLGLYPFLVALRQSFGEPATLSYWQALLAGKASAVLPFWTVESAQVFLWRPLVHSLAVAGAVTLLSTLLGALAGCLSALTDLRYARALQAAALFHLILPPYALALAWLSLAASIRLPEAWTFGPRPMVLVLTLHFFSLAYLFVGSAARNVDASLIEAGQVHRASSRAILHRIALPLLRPAILASAGLILFSALSTFAPMRLLGGGRRPYYVLATQIYSLYRNSLGDPRVAALAVALGLTLAAAGLPPALLFLRLLRQSRRYNSVGSRGHRVMALKLGPWREPLSLSCLALALASVAGPVLILFLQSLSPGSLSLRGLGTANFAAYRAIFLTGQYWPSLAGSLLLALITACAGVCASLPIAYALQRARMPVLRDGLYALTFLPFVLPGVAAGLAYFVGVTQMYHVFGRSVSLRFLYGSLPLAAAVSLARYLPLAVEAGASALMQIDPVLEEAAYVFRASFATALRRVLLPLLRQGTLLAWLLLFIFVYKEIDVLAFVYAPLPFGAGGGLAGILHAPPVMYQVFALIDAGETQGSYAQGTALLLIAVIVLLAASVIAASIGWRPFGEDMRTRQGIYGGSQN